MHYISLLTTQYHPRNLQQDPLSIYSNSSSNLLRGPLVRSHSIFNGYPQFESTPPQSLFLVAGQTGHGHGPATANRPRPPGHGHGHPATPNRPRPRPAGHGQPGHGQTATGHRPRPPDQDSATQPRQSCCFTGYKGNCCELCRLD